MINTSDDFEKKWYSGVPPKNGNPYLVVIKGPSYQPEIVFKDMHTFENVLSYFGWGERDPAGFYDINGDLFYEKDFVKWRRP